MGIMALAAYEARILALLDDAAQARFTTAQVDAALRWALNVYSQNRPLSLTYSLDTDGNQTIEIPDDFTGSHIMCVELYEADIDDVRALGFYAYQKDESWWIMTTGETIAAGEVLTITYSGEHTIDNLDSASGTTIPVEHEEFICIGAAGYALNQRVASRLESVNLNDDTLQRMMQIAQANISFFLTYITAKPGSSWAVMPTMATDNF
jgi:hypothetical protein